MNMYVSLRRCGEPRATMRFEMEPGEQESVVWAVRNGLLVVEQFDDEQS